jgi:hypothetical protein
MGESFSIDRGKSRPTPPTSAIRHLVPGGAVIPAIFVMTSTDLPTIAGFKLLCGSRRSSQLIRFGLTQKVRALQLELFTHSHLDGASTTTACSEAQIVPLSKHLRVRMS